MFWILKQLLFPLCLVHCWLLLTTQPNNSTNELRSKFCLVFCFCLCVCVCVAGSEASATDPEIIPEACASSDVHSDPGDISLGSVSMCSNSRNSVKSYRNTVHLVNH